RSVCCHDTPPTGTSTLSLHDALPICGRRPERPELVQELVPSREQGDHRAVARALRREKRRDDLAHDRPGRRRRGRIRENEGREQDRKSTRLNSSHVKISYAVFCLKKK